MHPSEKEDSLVCLHCCQSYRNGDHILAWYPTPHHVFTFPVPPIAYFIANVRAPCRAFVFSGCKRSFSCCKKIYFCICAPLCRLSNSSHPSQSPNPLLWQTTWAPEPRDVYWPNLSMPYWENGTRRLIVTAVVFAIVFFYLIPVTFVQGLTELRTLSQWLPGVKALSTM